MPIFNSKPTNYEEEALLTRQQCRLLYTEWFRSHLGAERQHVENQVSGPFCSTLYNVCILCRSLVSSPASWSFGRRFHFQISARGPIQTSILLWSSSAVQAITGIVAYNYAATVSNSVSTGHVIQHCIIWAISTNCREILNEPWNVYKRQASIALFGQQVIWRYWLQSARPI